MRISDHSNECRYLYKSPKCWYTNTLTAATITIKDGQEYYLNKHHWQPSAEISYWVHIWLWKWSSIDCVCMWFQVAARKLKPQAVHPPTLHERILEEIKTERKLRPVSPDQIRRSRLGETHTHVYCLRCEVMDSRAVYVECGMYEGHCTWYVSKRALD